MIIFEAMFGRPGQPIIFIWIRYRQLTPKKLRQNKARWLTWMLSLKEDLYKEAQAAPLPPQLDSLGLCAAVTLMIIRLL